MKITKAQLKQMIKEELEQTLEETPIALPEEQQQLNEHPALIAALKSPQVQQMLMQIVMPLIQSALSKGAGDEQPKV